MGQGFGCAAPFGQLEPDELLREPAPAGSHCMRNRVRTEGRMPSFIVE